MSLKDILVVFDPLHSPEPRLQVAAALAARHGAHLTGLCVIPPVLPTEAGLPWSGAIAEAQAVQRVRENLMGASLAAAARIEEGFRAAAENSAVASEWRAPAGPPLETVPVHARYADLVILGQIDPRHRSDAAFGLAEATLFGSGRPVLIVPYAGTFATVGRNVLVAWNATRESARAVNDALPLLEGADKVTVLAINPGHGGSELRPAARPVHGVGDDGNWPAADIAHHLARHGVKAEAAYTISDEIDIGNTILSRAADFGVDSIVMGAYGHSRLREFVMGGATRTLLETMTVPVLLSH